MQTVAQLEAIGLDLDKVIISFDSNVLSIELEDDVIVLSYALDQGNTGVTRKDVIWIGSEDLGADEPDEDTFKIQFMAGYDEFTGVYYTATNTAIFIDKDEPLVRPFITGLENKANYLDPITPIFSGTGALYIDGSATPVAFTSGTEIEDTGAYLLEVTHNGKTTVVVFTLANLLFITSFEEEAGTTFASVVDVEIECKVGESCEIPTMTWRIGAGARINDIGSPPPWIDGDKVVVFSTSNSLIRNIDPIIGFTLLQFDYSLRNDDDGIADFEIQISNDADTWFVVDTLTIDNFTVPGTYQLTFADLSPAQQLIATSPSGLYIRLYKPTGVNNDDWVIIDNLMIYASTVLLVP